MITLTPKPPTAEERKAMLRLAKAARDSMVEEYSKLPRQDDVLPFYILVAPGGDSFVWKMDPRSESEQQQLVAQVRRVVANSRPEWVLKVWPGQMAVPPGSAARDVLIVHIEGQRGVLAVGHVPVERDPKSTHPALGPLHLQVFDTDFEPVTLTYGGDYFHDLQRGRSEARVH